MNTGDLLTLSKILFAGSVALGAWALARRHVPSGAAIAAWSVAVLALAIGVGWGWAIYSDHDNLEHGLRPGRLVLPAILAAAALAHALWRTRRLNGSRSADAAS